MTEQSFASQVSNAYSRAKGSDPATSRRMHDYALKFLPIVKNEVLRFKMRVPRHIELEELHGVAICGLMKAFSRYRDEDEDSSFGAYVRQRVRGSILDELRRLDSMPRASRKKARWYDDAVIRVEQRVGRLATEKEVREELGLQRDEFNALLEELRPITFFSLDELNDDRKGTSLSERLQDPNDLTACERLESAELLNLLRERLESLPEVQRKVLHMYYFKDFRLAEIATVFAVSESRICQLHTQAIRSLRTIIERQLRKEEPEPISD